MSGENKITGETSDGYHTFNELYDHRCLLWINYCLTNPQGTYLVHDHFDGWFLLGKETIVGQISYHCPNKYIDLVMSIDQRHPEFDGHTSQDVIERLIKLTTSRNIRSPIANNGVSLDYIKKVVDDSTSNILDDCCLDKISSAIHAKLQPTAINNGVSLHEITELVSALEDMINYYKPHNWVSTETGYEVLNKAQKVLSKLPTTAPRGGNMIDVVKKAVESGAVVIKPCTANCLNGIITDHEGAEVRDIVCPTCSGREYVITEGDVSGG